MHFILWYRIVLLIIMQYIAFLIIHRVYYFYTNIAIYGKKYCVCVENEKTKVQILKPIFKSFLNNYLFFTHTQIIKIAIYGKNEIQCLHLYPINSNIIIARYCIFFNKCITAYIFIQFAIKGEILLLPMSENY